MTDAPTLDWTREQDPQTRQARRAAAYAAVFGTELGQAVLLDLVAEAGVFDPLGAPAAERPSLLEYHTGRRDHALELAALAGVDRVALAVAHQQRERAQALADHDLEQGTYHGRSDFDG